jgi:hypothetical protein
LTASFERCHIVDIDADSEGGAGDERAMLRDAPAAKLLKSLRTSADPTRHRDSNLWPSALEASRMHQYRWENVL